jgi:hypothetical protein
MLLIFLAFQSQFCSVVWLLLVMGPGSMAWWNGQVGLVSWLPGRIWFSSAKISLVRLLGDKQLLKNRGMLQSLLMGHKMEMMGHEGERACVGPMCD